MTQLLDKLTHTSSKALIEVLAVWMKTRDMGFWDLRVNHRYSNWSRDEKPDYNLIKDSEFAWILKGCSTAGPVEFPPLLSSCCNAPIKTETNIKGKNFDVCSSCGLDPFPTPHYEQVVVEKEIHSQNQYLKNVESNLKFLSEILDDNSTSTDTKMLAEAGLDWVCLMVRKNIDYGSSAYERPLLDPSLPARTAIKVRMSDKIKRLISLSNKGPLVNESYEDTMKDLGVYCLLYLTAPKEES